MIAVILTIILIVLFYASVAMYFKFGTFKAIYHDVFGWHQPRIGDRSFDGCSIHAHCKYCGEEIMQDSQGNWFTY